VGLLTPSEGEAWIAGYHVLRQSMEVKQRLAFLPDQPFLYDHLTVGELMGFVGGMYRLDPSTWQQRAEALLEQFGLSSHAGRRVGELSYGMKSRLVLIASLLHEPQVFILDEPFFGLDPQTLRLMKTLLVERASCGMTIMLSTHQLAIVEDLAQRIAILSEGRLVALGTWDQLRQAHGGSHLEDVFFHLTGA
jgi:ABC-2 type transport system ATP-binding protein